MAESNEYGLLAEVAGKQGLGFIEGFSGTYSILKDAYREISVSTEELDRKVKSHNRYSRGSGNLLMLASLLPPLSIGGVAYVYNFSANLFGFQEVSGSHNWLTLSAPILFGLAVANKVYSTFRLNRSSRDFSVILDAAYSQAFYRENGEMSGDDGEFSSLEKAVKVSTT